MASSTAPVASRVRACGQRTRPWRAALDPTDGREDGPRSRSRAAPNLHHRLSAGGAMTSVMLATYPELFAGGAILAGLPYRCAIGLQEALDCMANGQSRT